MRITTDSKGIGGGVVDGVEDFARYADGGIDGCRMMFVNCRPICGAYQNPLRKFNVASALPGDSGITPSGVVLLAAGESAEIVVTPAPTLPSRVVVPAGVTLCGAGAGTTFIVGSKDTTETGDEHKRGPKAVRCVYLMDGAMLEGFTLRDCVISNCVAGRGGAAFGGRYANCRIVGNIGVVNGTMRNAYAYNCYFNQNRSNEGILDYFYDAYNCTFGQGNFAILGGNVPGIANPMGAPTVANCLFLAGGSISVASANVVQDLTKPFVVPANTELDLWWDLQDYYCAYPELETSGGKGATVTWGWTESLRDERGEKGDRGEWRGKRFSQIFSDTFVSDGRADAFFTAPWWRCGRWCRLCIKTAAAPLEVKRVAIGESRYPLSVDASFQCDDPVVDDIRRISLRTMQMCCHEMLFDCPYYEQQMYPGDTRIQLQMLNALTADGRMSRFAMSVYDWNRRDNGLVAMNFPSRALQESCTYTMCWILMFRDYLLWHDDLSFLRERMPGVRNALAGLGRYEDSDGLLADMPGWCFMDWVEDWPKSAPDFPTGVAPSGAPGHGASALENLLYLMALQSAEAVDSELGESEFAALYGAFLRVALVMHGGGIYAIIDLLFR